MTDQLVESSKSMPKPSIWRTPLRVSDVLRGRFVRVPDLRARLAAAALPEAAAELIARVVRRTRLWKLEKLAVADELIAHFADGVAAGLSADVLVRDFGDERVAAKLISRSKKRNRSLVWHAWKWWARLNIAVIALYSFVAIRFVMSHPTISVDYLAEFNAAAAATPVQDRAWPIYREAILALDWQDDRASRYDRSDPFEEMLMARPGDARWPELVAWIDSSRTPIARVREASAKPEFGFLIGDGQSSFDPAMGWNNPRIETRPPMHSEALDKALLTVGLPYLNLQRNLSLVLAADARVARQRQDGTRTIDDLLAIRGMAKQLRLNTPIDRAVSISVDETALDEANVALRESPELFSDEQLVSLAHRLSEIGGDNAGTVLNYDGERAFFYDVLQRIFTDDGNSDGRLTWEGARSLSMIMGISDSTRAPQSAAMFASTFGLVSAQKTRAFVRSEYDQLLDRITAQMSRPLYTLATLDGSAYVAKRLGEIRSSPIESARLFPLLLMIPSPGRSQERAERLLGDRDGVVIGIGLELYRRRHGDYPATLGELSPTFLPRVPVDRITGGALKYRLVGGKPLVYSLGVDRDDDGGRVPVDREKKPEAELAADWPASAADAKNEGDWVIFGEPTNAARGATTVP